MLLLTHALAKAARRGRLPTLAADVPVAVRVLPTVLASRPDEQIPGATWQAIVALHARYPMELGRLRMGWWNENSHIETLTALAAWRAQLDSAPDHLQELAYQHQLQSYAQRLRSEPGGTANTWTPGAAKGEAEGSSITG